MKCSICGENIKVHPLSGWDQGHNAQPINNGRCCDVCNSKIVIPKRIEDITIREVKNER